MSQPPSAPQKSGNFEDQLRNMIQSSAGSPAPAQNASAQTPPQNQGRTPAHHHAQQIHPQATRHTQNTAPTQGQGPRVPYGRGHQNQNINPIHNQVQNAPFQNPQQVQSRTPVLSHAQQAPSQTARPPQGIAPIYDHVPKAPFQAPHPTPAPLHATANQQPQPAFGNPNMRRKQRWQNAQELYQQPAPAAARQYVPTAQTPTILPRPQNPPGPANSPWNRPVNVLPGPSVNPPPGFARPQQHPSAGQANQRALTAPGNQHAAAGRGQYPPRQQGFQQRPQQVYENPMVQIQYLDHFASQIVPTVEMSSGEHEEKEAFRRQLEAIFKDAIAKEYSGDLATIDLVGFGSFSSGFASPGSDVDLAIVPVWKDGANADKFEMDKSIPRILEKAVLDHKMGGRLLSRTRVPILKVCQQPSEQLYQALYDERKQWDELPEEEQYPELHPPTPAVDKVAELDMANLKLGSETSDISSSKAIPSSNVNDGDVKEKDGDKKEGHARDQKPREQRTWHREKVLGPLDFPKEGVGIQCDINFSNPLGIQNTALLRCYSLCDVRVRPMVLFVKQWAKVRKINSSYSGTLSSYGWVLMVLHYLINIARPPVLPNLQGPWRPHTVVPSLEQMFTGDTIAGYNVRFWRNEKEIMDAAHRGLLTRNRETLGALLRGFFQYYAISNPYGPYAQRPQIFYWTNEVLSLQTTGGIVRKSDKGWTGAKTTMVDGKEVRHRYLLAIEDPFELDHNVARTVTHRGIVAIRDEFRRAWRIISQIGRNEQPEGSLFDELVEPPPEPKAKVEEEALSKEEEEEALSKKNEKVPDEHPTASGIPPMVEAR